MGCDSVFDIGPGGVDEAGIQQILVVLLII
jgi:hypothetical protein